MHCAAALEVNIRIAAQSRLERRVQIRFIGSYKHACRMERNNSKVGLEGARHVETP